MKSIKSHSLALGIAFVGFTTQFGGGFASGAQIYQYFINYGIWGIVMPIVAQFLLSLFYWYGMKYAFRYKKYDYRSFSNSFYGKTKVIFSNLYEIEYFIMVCMAPAVAFATGGATLSALLNIPYIICTIIIGIFILLITLWGSDIVRKCSSFLSVIIIVGLFVVLIPNIICQFDVITDSISKLYNGSMPVGSKESGSFLSALWQGTLYGIFQITAIGLMYQHVRRVKDEKEVGISMIYMFFINTIVMLLTVLGLLAVAFNSELSSYSVPMLLLVKSGVGSKVLTPIISILIILGSISTGVNMIAGIVERIVNQIQNRKKETNSKKQRIYFVVVSLLFTLLTFGIAQFGLIPLVKVGYSYIGYATIVVIIIPFVIHYIVNLFKKGDKINEVK
ncbi:MAG: hypothetical protein GX275_04735 [Clostridiales bacterium]|nr:hypothetical protein [Clostridiales bacterium]